MHFFLVNDWIYVYWDFGLRSGLVAEHSSIRWKTLAFGWHSFVAGSSFTPSVLMRVLSHRLAGFILDLHAAREPTYCCFRPHYQHLLFQFPWVWLTDGLDYQSTQPATQRCFEGSPWQDVPEREKLGRWDGARVSPPNLVPWLVMAGPPAHCIMHQH